MTLREEIEEAIADYSRPGLFPPPYDLAPNLKLASRALAALGPHFERERCEETDSGGARCELVKDHKAGHFIHFTGDKPHPERFYF